MPIQIKSMRQAMIAKAFLMALFENNRRVMEKVHLAFDRPDVAHLTLSLEEQNRMQSILWDISNCKIDLKKDLAWDGLSQVSP